MSQPFDNLKTVPPTQRLFASKKFQRFTSHIRGFTSKVRCLKWLALAVVLILAGSTQAQQPDPNGWSSDTNNSIYSATPPPIKPDLDLNPPQARLLPQPSPSSGASGLPDEYRSQIGFAAYEEPINQQNNSGAAPVTPIDTRDTYYTSDIAQANDSTNNQTSKPQNIESAVSDLFASQTEQLTSPEGLGSSIKVAMLLATLSLAPAIILMTTCYIRVVVVLTLLKQAFGAQQLPPTQVITALSLFITLLVMTPVWNEVKTEAIDPYTQTENGISWDEAWERGIVPVKRFMGNQIEVANNGESIALFYKYLPDQPSVLPTNVQEVPINVLLPAFVVSELKVAFLLGFQIYLPFLVLDLVVSSVTVSTGMLMLPPTMVSFPLKLILFVLVDGWNLVVGMLLQSFAPFT